MITQELEVTNYIPNQEILPRSIFLSRASEQRRYFDGFIGVQNNFRTWEEKGEPDIVLIRNDGWGLCVRSSNLSRALSLYDWETVLIKKEE